MTLHHGVVSEIVRSGRDNFLACARLDSGEIVLLKTSAAREVIMLCGIPTVSLIDMDHPGRSPYFELPEVEDEIVVDKSWPEIAWAYQSQLNRVLRIHHLPGSRQALLEHPDMPEFFGDEELD